MGSIKEANSIRKKIIVKILVQPKKQVQWNLLLARYTNLPHNRFALFLHYHCFREGQLAIRLRILFEHNSITFLFLEQYFTGANVDDVQEMVLNEKVKWKLSDQKVLLQEISTGYIFNIVCCTFDLKTDVSIPDIMNCDHGFLVCLMFEEG